MGVAQCDPRRLHTCATYLSVYALILFYREVPWIAAVAPFNSRVDRGR